MRKYVLLSAIIIALSLFALRLPMYPPFDLPLLKRPLIISIVRLIQLLISVGAMIILATSFVKQLDRIRLFARIYIYSGLISACYAIISWAALHAGFDIGIEGAYGNVLPRARGFFVEGGPFGVYLMSVIMVVLFRTFVMHDSYRLTAGIQISILLIAIFAAASKAAIFLSFFLLMHYMIMSKKFGLPSLILIILIIPFVMLGAHTRLAGYVQDYSNFAELAIERSEDSNLVMGRVMAAHLVPRMIAEHPFGGIGFGNYSLQRNNPNYLQGLPTTSGWDLPGLGLAGYVAELGVPLVLFLIWLIWYPVKVIRFHKVSILVVLTASYQFFAHLVGVQITFVYPWLLTALALGYALNQPLLTLPNSTSSAVIKVCNVKSLL